MERSRSGVRIQETSNGLMDLEHLDAELECRAGTSRQLIGSFSAASNITGILTDVDATTVLLHQHGALAFWDYATAAPYVKIDMNPVVNGTSQGLVYKDAVFFSPHKFIGGPETPGISKKIFVSMIKIGRRYGLMCLVQVSRTGHRYLKQAEMREEGGTPAIVGAIRAGLVLQLKEAVTCARIKEREEQLIQQAMSAWRKIPELEILGSETAPRLPIFSLMVHHPNSGLMLHHNFLAALLNDLFGLQTRGGCACAGPYALDLLGIDEPLARHLDALLAEDENFCLKYSCVDSWTEPTCVDMGSTPAARCCDRGSLRLNLAYFLSDHQVEFVLEAVSFVARHGWKFLPLYLYNPETGEWRHRHHQVYADRRWLGAISYNSGKLSYNLPPSSNQPAPSLTLVSNRDLCGDQEVMFDEEAAKMRWFLLPSEAAAHLRNPHSAPRRTPPFRPNNHLNNGVTQPQMTCALRKPNKMDPATLAKWQKYFAMKSPWHCPPANIFKPFKQDKFSRRFFAQAVEEFGMIQNGDRVLACLSGGKDSLSMLHTLHQYQFSARKKGISFELGAMTVDPKSSAYDPSPLKQYLAALKVPYFYQEQVHVVQAMIIMGIRNNNNNRIHKSLLSSPTLASATDIIGQASAIPGSVKSICSFCSRMKRGIIYACARNNGYNVIALGQHLDDLAESTCGSSHDNHAVLCDVQERHRVKQLLASQEVMFPRLFISLKAGLKPLMALNRTGLDGKFTLPQHNDDDEEEES
ncbi:hypothetical protein LAZ67_10000376 [Cordylochernes scorpioides]|uniref:Aminotransferase class V domain-containing protein n=1 Tax=Cordylochernes scorpioides TaxID=51811 RepID=A0ABY6KXT7_9ARAC|nr:hypothetical protein LAZ67_10000376 [Cordylochernes scorpioides]